MISVCRQTRLVTCVHTSIQCSVIALGAWSRAAEKTWTSHEKRWRWAGEKRWRKMQLNAALTPPLHHNLGRNTTWWNVCSQMRLWALWIGALVNTGAFQIPGAYLWHKAKLHHTSALRPTLHPVVNHNQPHVQNSLNYCFNTVLCPQSSSI